MIETNTGAKKIEGSDGWREIFDVHNESVEAEDKIQQDVAPIIYGKKCSQAVASGEYVLLRKSTISGKTDGAYKAAKAIPADTNIDSTYLGNKIDGGIANELNSNINSHSDYKSSIITDDVTINAAYKKTLADFVLFYFDFMLTAAKSAMDNVMHGLPTSINGAAYVSTALGHTPSRESTTYRFSVTGDGYLKTLDAIPNGTQIRLTFGYFT